MNTNQYRPGGFRGLTPVVKNLLIINILFFLGSYALGHAFKIDLTDYLGLHYFKSGKFNAFQFVSYMFMHGGIGHIFFNMFALWMFGNVLEQVWGGKRFLTYYMVTGIGAAIIQTLIMWWEFHGMESAAAAYIANPEPEAFLAFVNSHFPAFSNQLSSFVSGFRLYPEDTTMVQQSIQYVQDLIQLKMDVPTVGASGAVFGILLAFGMLFPNALLYIYFAIPIKAKYFVILYGALELYLGISNNPGDNVAHFAHLGGMVFGYFMLLYWRKKTKGRPF